MPTRVHLIAGARPNFMKVAPLHRALAATDWATPVFVHTGQHYDAEMSDIFLAELGLPEPDFHLEAGSGLHGEQTAAVLVAYERVCMKDDPDWVVVAGDVNSTLAAALAAAKLGIPVAHLEAGLRSGDRSMPEELNRIATDAISDLLWTPSIDADANLRREGIDEERVERIGNVMIDSFEHLRPVIEELHAASMLGLEPGTYAVVTIHRPSNVDDPDTLLAIVDQLRELAADLPVVFSVHPRNAARLDDLGAAGRLTDASGVTILPPVSYVQFLSLVLDAGVVVTDSGGIQEETTHIGIPCLTVRSTTERPVTITSGTNQLVSVDQIAAHARLAVGRGERTRTAIPLWDGHAAERAVASLRARTA